jgi:transmembrane sensor
MHSQSDKDREAGENAVETRAREATAWFVRMQNVDITAADREAFRRWLAENPLHHRAFNEVKLLSGKLDSAAIALGEGAWYRQGLKRRTFSWWAGSRLIPAFGVCLLLGLGVMLWRDAGIFDRARGDFSTRPGERRDVTLADGSRVYLDGDTAITVKLSSDERKIILLRGRAWFDVVHNTQSPFSVQTLDVETRVLGTAFAVDRDAEDVGITVERGLVAVSGAGAEKVHVPAGEQVWVDGGHVGAPTKVEPEIALAWKRGLIILDQAPLGKVIDELARMRVGRVVITDKALRDLKLTGVFRADDPEAVVEALHSALGLKTLALPGLATFVYR